MSSRGVWLEASLTQEEGAVAAGSTPYQSLGVPRSLALPKLPFPCPPLAPMTMTAGPTAPKTGAPELFMASAASLPQGDQPCGIFALDCCPWGSGASAQS